MAAYKDLREWIDIVNKMGQLAHVEGADWNLEIGAITAINAKQAGRKAALLFDKVIGYPEGFRVLTSALNSVERLALTCNLPSTITDMEFVRTWAKRFKSIVPIPPRVVSGGPILENVREGEDVDLFKFPTPRWNELDGGRYIGTGCMVVTKDPDTNEINCGCYRVMIHDAKTLVASISPMHHAALHRQKWFQQGKPCPVAISFGHDPLLFLLAATPVPKGLSEYDIAGGVREEPYDVLRAPETGLPIPASAEIAVEGFWHADEKVPEGPFAEFTGYYASTEELLPAIKVKRLMYRKDPILLGTQRGHPPDDPTFWQTRMKASAIWEGLNAAGVPDVQGVWCHHPNSNLFTVVSIKQRYAGHARQAGMVTQFCGASGGTGKWTIVVDDDIDPSNISEVLWAIGTRADPERAVEITRFAASIPLESSRPPGDRLHTSRCLIEACRPWEWKDQFPIVAAHSPEYAHKIKEKWAAKLWTER